MTKNATIPSPTSRASITAVASTKGGVGCTTIVALLARALAGRGHTVLLVDMDPRGYLTATVTGHDADLNDRFRDTVPVGHAGAFALGNKSVESIPLDLGDGISLLGSLPHRADEGLAMNAGQWRAALANIACGFDHVLIDCASGMGEFASTALSGADHVLVPTTPVHFAIKGAVCQIEATTRLAETVAPGLTVLGVVVNEARVDDTGYMRAMESEPQKMIDSSLLLSSRITRTDDELAFAYDDPEGATAREFAALADELLARIGHHPMR